jgi:hypothetical protein
MPKSNPELATSSKPVVQRAPATGRLVRLCVAAWVVPGAGHYMLGHRKRALILFGCIVLMFAFGLLMKGEFFSLQSASYLESLGYFGELAVGVPMPIAAFFGYAGDPFFVSADFGTAFLVAAGMLNILTILDTYDIAMGRKP